MAFQHCAACPSPGACSETILPEDFRAPISCNGPGKPGMCWNAYASVQQYKARQGAQPAAQASQGAQEAPAPQPAAKAPQAPRSPRPAGGSVTEQIFATCDAQWAALGGSKERSVLDAARKAAIPVLEAAGVNPNSARKGSSMWVAARQ